MPRRLWSKKVYLFRKPGENENITESKTFVFPTAEIALGVRRTLIRTIPVKEQEQTLTFFEDFMLWVARGECKINLEPMVQDLPFSPVQRELELATPTAAIVLRPVILCASFPKPSVSPLLLVVV